MSISGTENVFATFNFARISSEYGRVSECSNSNVGSSAEKSNAT